MDDATSPARHRTNHFALANPLGSGDEGNVAVLLRRVADSIERHGAVWVQDLVLHHDVTEEGTDWCSVTVYFADRDGPEGLRGRT